MINIFVKIQHISHGEDANVLAGALKFLGYSSNVYHVDSSEDLVKEALINIFIEKPRRTLFSKAKFNWLIPNPGHFKDELSALDNLDLILCRNHEVERIFKSLNKPTYYLGFTCGDLYKPPIPKKLRQFLHVAGASARKGTTEILDLWKKRPDFPSLHLLSRSIEIPTLQNIIPHRSLLDRNVVIFLKNQCGIHLCPSQIEGFGYNIIEGMAAKAVVVTTNAPPMNEYINDPRCLVNYRATYPLRLGTVYEVDVIDLERKIDALLTLSDADLQAVGEINRQNYLKSTIGFLSRLKALLYSINNH